MKRFSFGCATRRSSPIRRSIKNSCKRRSAWPRSLKNTASSRPAGALTAAALYLYHREKELDEYERLLFSDDYEDDDYDDEDSTTYENIPSAPAEEKE